MDKLINLLKNVKRGPITTTVGVVVFLFGGYLVYMSKSSLTWDSVPTGLFIVGIVLLVVPDGKAK